MTFKLGNSWKVSSNCYSCKTVGSTKTEYLLDGSTILAQKTGSTVMPFYYDANGTRLAFKYNGEMYYYVYNAQGDVTHIQKSDKTIAGTYQYDPYGRIINLSSLTAVAKANPFRYRGYYYDTESNMYYLNSRYYNPEFGRFINADGYVSSGQGITGFNMFAYCNNNPVVFKDEFGTRPNVSLCVADTGSKKNNSTYSIKTPFPDTAFNEYIVGKGEPQKGKINIAYNPSNVNKKGEPNPSIQVVDSYKYRYEFEMRAICEHIVQSQYYDQDIYGRTVDSMIIEWDFHNDIYYAASLFYGIPVIEKLRERAMHVDLDSEAEGRSWWDHVYVGLRGN